MFAADRQRRRRCRPLKAVVRHHQMISYDRKCHACNSTNIRGTEICENFGCPAISTGYKIQDFLPNSIRIHMMKPVFTPSQKITGLISAGLIAIYFFGFEYFPSFVLILLFWASFILGSVYVFRVWKSFFKPRNNVASTTTKGLHGK